MSESNAYGPIDFVLLEFPDQEPSGDAARELAALVDSGTIRLYDIAAIRKAADGSFSALEISTLSSDESFGRFAGARSGLLSADDLAAAADALKPGTLAVLLVFENAWAVPFVAAAERAGGELVASSRISAQEVMNALDALEANG